MMYKVKIDDYVLPFGATKIETKIKNRNKDVELLNGQVMSLVKSPGLTEWTIETTMPNPDGLLGKLERLKLDKKPFTLTIVRDGSLIPDDGDWVYANDGMTSATVTIENYTRSESVEVGKRSKIKMTFREYLTFKTSSVEINKVDNYNVYELVSRLNSERDIPNEYVVPIPKYLPYSWSMVSLKVYGSISYSDAIRKTNLQFENDGSFPTAPIDKFPGELYPIPGSKLTIDTIKIMNIYVADTGYKADNNVVTSDSSKKEPTRKPVCLIEPESGTGDARDPYRFTLHYGDSIKWYISYDDGVKFNINKSQFPKGITLYNGDTAQPYIGGIVEYGIECRYYRATVYSKADEYNIFKGPEFSNTIVFKVER